MKSFITALGFDWVQVRYALCFRLFLISLFSKAPGEAEAELAWRNQDGSVDVVMTDDSDILVFGAKTVLRV